MTCGPADLVAIALRLRRSGAGLLLAAARPPRGPREQAKRLHDRLAGVPPSEAVLDLMAAQIATGNPADRCAATNVAMQNPHFYYVRAQELRDALDERGPHVSAATSTTTRPR